MLKSFKDKVVLITGASAGVGAASARRFAADGAKLVLAARGAEKLEALAGELSAGENTVTPITADVSDPAQCRRLIAQTVETHGRIDVLVNNAGVNHRGPIKGLEAEQLAQIVDTNLRAPIMLTKMALAHIPAGGAIVNVASIAGQIPVVDEATYSATKFGLRAFTYALAEELKEAQISVSAVSPGPIETGFILEDLDHVPDFVFSQPMSTADEIAELVFQCAADGKVERSKPGSTHAIATLGYLFPSLPRLMRPLLEPRGRKNKEKYRAKHGL